MQRVAFAWTHLVAVRVQCSVSCGCIYLTLCALLSNMMPLHAHLTQAALPEKCEVTTWAVCRETYAAVLCGIPRSGWTYHVVVVVTAKLAHHGAAI